MKLWRVALMGIALAVGAFAAGSKLRPQGRAYSARQTGRRSRAAKLCATQGPNCRVLERPGQPRDLTGLGCVCD